MPHTHEGRGFTIATRQHVVSLASPGPAAMQQPRAPLAAPPRGALAGRLLQLRGLIGDVLSGVTSTANSVISTVGNTASNALGALNGLNSPSLPQPITSVYTPPPYTPPYTPPAQTTPAYVAPTTRQQQDPTTPAYTPPAATTPAYTPPVQQTTQQQQNTPTTPNVQPVDSNPTTQAANGGGGNTTPVTTAVNNGGGNNGGGGGGGSGTTAGSGSGSNQGNGGGNLVASQAANSAASAADASASASLDSQEASLASMASQTGGVTTTNAQGQTIVSSNQSAAAAAASSLSSLQSSRAAALSGRSEASVLASEASVLATGGVITTTDSRGQSITLSGTSAASALASSASALTATRTGAPLATGIPTGAAGANGGEDRSSDSKGPIIGGVVGGVAALLLLLGFLFWFFVKRRSNKKSDTRHESFFSPGAAAAYENYPASPTFQGFPVTFNSNAQQSASQGDQFNLFPARTGPTPPPLSTERGAVPHSQRTSGPLGGYTPIVRAGAAGIGTSRPQFEAYPVQASLMFPANLKAPQTIRAVHATSYSTASTALSTGSSILDVGSGARSRSGSSSGGSDVGTPTTIRGFVAANVAANAFASSSYALEPVPPSPAPSEQSEVDPFRRARAPSPTFADQLMAEHRVSMDSTRSNDGSVATGWSSPTVTVFSQSTSTVTGPTPTFPTHFSKKPEGIPEPTLNTAWTSTRVSSIFPNIAPPKPIVLRHSQHQGSHTTPSPILESSTLGWSPNLMYPSTISAGTSPNQSSVSLDSFATALSGRTPAESVVDEPRGRPSLDSNYSDDDNVEDLHAAFDPFEDPFEDSHTPRESLQSLQSIASTSTLKGPTKKEMAVFRGSLAPSSQADSRESTATTLDYLSERPPSRIP